MKLGRIWKLSTEELKTIISRCESGTQVLRELGYKQFSGDSLKALRKRCECEKIDLPSGIHKNKQTLKNGSDPLRMLDSEIFKLDSVCSQKTVRNHYKQLFPEICSVCSMNNVWNNHSISMDLDHINGNRNDNRFENLRWLCPNCHSQTQTYGSKNYKKKT